MNSTWQIDLFFGQLSPHMAQVYARIDGLPGGQEWTLAGRVRGPHCQFAHTLPANYVLADLGPGPALLARASIPDPCFWSPELPARYQVSVELRRRTRSGSLETVQGESRELGLRWLGTRGSSFYFEGKRWVLRGISRAGVVDTPLAEWREAGTAMLVERPSDALCREADEEGVLLVARGVDDTAELQRLSQWASVAMVTGSQSAAAVRQAAPNLIWVGSGQMVGNAGAAATGSAWFLDAELLAAAKRTAADLECAVPLVAVRQLPGIRSFSEARAEVDRLQSDLAPLGDFAGYVIDAGR